MLRTMLDRMAPRDGTWSRILIPPVFLVAAAVTKLQGGPAASDPGPLIVIASVYAGVGLAIGLLAAQLPRLPRAAVLVGVIGIAFDLAFSIEHQLSIYIKQNWTTALLPRAAVIAVVLWGAAAIVLAAIGRRRWRALLAVGAAYLLAVVAIPQSPLPEIPAPTAKVRADGPLGRIVVQILLDEHIGPAGIPSGIPIAGEMRRTIGDFYVSRGFRLFDDAYSPFTFTAASVPAMLDLDDPDPAHATMIDLERRWNRPMAWFQTYKSAGYRTMAYTIGSFWNLCTGSRGVIDDCRIYDPVSRDREGPFRVRYHQYLAAVVDSSILEKTLCKWAVDCGGDEYNVASNSVKILDQLTHEIDVASGDVAVFVHVLLPHRPQRVDETCAVRYLGDTDTEAELYDRYLGQIRCSMRMIDRVIAAIDRRGALARATIIVHGDHGLRPGEDTDTPARLQQMTHSTLFAVRALGVEPGRDGAMYRVQSLIAHFVGDRPLVPGDGVVWRYQEDPNVQPPLGQLRFAPQTATSDPAR